MDVEDGFDPAMNAAEGSPADVLYPSTGRPTGIAGITKSGFGSRPPEPAEGNVGLVVSRPLIILPLGMVMPARIRRMSEARSVSACSKHSTIRFASGPTHSTESGYVNEDSLSLAPVPVPPRTPAAKGENEAISLDDDDEESGEPSGRRKCAYLFAPA